MRRFLIIYALCSTLIIVAATTIIINLHRERRRLHDNQHALLADIEHYRTSLDESPASVEVLKLRCDEYRELRRRDMEELRRMGLRLRRLESVATHASVTQLCSSAPLHDTLVAHRKEAVVRHDTLRLFRWSDGWVDIEGTIARDSISCHVVSRDTLRQVVHRVPRRFLFFRYGTKAIRQEIISSNPHTHIVYSEYIELPRRRKR